MKNTPVIFRKFRSNGEVIAMFPTIPGTNNPYVCSSYTHIGQHGSAGLSLICDTDLAKPAEYESLLRELVAIGYDDLKVYSRSSRKFDIIRHAAI